MHAHAIQQTLMFCFSLAACSLTINQLFCCLQNMHSELKTNLTVKWMFACGGSWAWEASNLVSLASSSGQPWRPFRFQSGMKHPASQAYCSARLQVEHLNRKVSLRVQIQKPFGYCDGHNVLGAAAPSFTERIERMVSLLLSATYRLMLSPLCLC